LNVIRIGQEVEITGTVDRSCQYIVTETEVMVNKLCKTVHLYPFTPVTLGFEVFFLATNEIMFIVLMMTVL
jgi:hypothetical protein